RRLESSDVTVLFRTVPPTIEIGRHFTVEAVVCAPTPLPTRLRIDAQMPEHRHGMNYRPTVVKGGDGVYVAEGMLFHMPGRWHLLVAGGGEARVGRLSTDLHLECGGFGSERSSCPSSLSWGASRPPRRS